MLLYFTHDSTAGMYVHVHVGCIITGEPSNVVSVLFLDVPYTLCTVLHCMYRDNSVCVQRL